jgi:GNAT superfamily N-acetyltransferase
MDDLPPAMPGVQRVPPGHIATIVTCLEMRAPPPPAPPVKSALVLRHWPAPVDVAAYLALFRAIGQPWLWQGRLRATPAATAAVLDADTTEVHVACRRDGSPQGLIELDFSTPGQCELVYFGLVPGLTGAGHGAWLMAHALRRAWRPGINRLWVHTCDLDHPGALSFYQRMGFVPYERWVEVYTDPRSVGLYPPDTAPRVPLL